MDDLRLIPRMLQPVGDENADGQRLLRVHAPLAGQPRLERFAFDKLRCEVMDAVVFARRVNLDDVRVIQPRGGFGLVLETRDEVRVLRHPWGDDLQRDNAVEHRLAGLEHGAHAAGPKLLQDRVTAECLADQVRHNNVFQECAENSQMRRSVSSARKSCPLLPIMPSDPPQS